MIIYRDTREKKGHNFEFHPEVKLMIRKLDEGDYLFKDTQTVIERKASTAELYMNLGSNERRERFYRECERLQKYENPIILCEFPESYLYEFPKYSLLPKRVLSTLRMSSQYFRKLVYDLPNNFPPIKLVFCNNRTVAEERMIQIYRDLQNGQTKKFDF